MKKPSIGQIKKGGNSGVQKSKQKRLWEGYPYTTAYNPWSNQKEVETKKAIKTGPSFWESEGIEVIENCSIAPKDKVVYISPLVYEKIKLLMNKYKNREWLAYLVGENDHVTDMYFPKQTASSASVTDIDLPSNIKVIGVMHSHHHMMGQFSDTDDEYINSNHGISILVTHKSITGQYKWKTPCGKYTVIKCNVQVSYDAEFDTEGFIKDVEGKMCEQRVTYVYPGKTSEEISRKSKDEKSETNLDEELEEFFDQFEDDDRYEDEPEELYFEDETLAEEMARMGEVLVTDE